MTAMAIQRPWDTASLFQGFWPRSADPDKPAPEGHR